MGDQFLTIAWQTPEENLPFLLHKIHKGSAFLDEMSIEDGEIMDNDGIIDEAYNKKIKDALIKLSST